MACGRGATMLEQAMVAALTSHVACAIEADTLTLDAGGAGLVLQAWPSHARTPSAFPRGGERDGSPAGPHAGHRRERAGWSRAADLTAVKSKAMLTPWMQTCSSP
jgi:hypothetical protein